MKAQQQNVLLAATILTIAIMLTCSHFVGAQNIRRLDAPAGAFVELSTGERRTLADLLEKHAWALKDSDSSGAPGVWCCVPVWNGRSRGEMWANVVAVANSTVALSTDANCATRVCNQTPITVPAFVNLCPQTLPCGSAQNGPIHDGGSSGNSSSSASSSTSALPRTPPPSPPPSPPSSSPQPDAVSSSSSNDIKVGAANGPPPSSPSVAGRLDVVVLPAEVVARSSGGGSRRGALSIISSALLLSVVAGVPLLLFDV